MSEMKDVLLVGPDDGSDIVKDVAGSAVVGESSTRDPRLSWRQIPVDIQNANSWAFEIELIGSPGLMRVPLWAEPHHLKTVSWVLGLD